jgi:mannose-6-phosphate isomerase-like protein (cupin superfamily)
LGAVDSFIRVSIMAESARQKSKKKPVRRTYVHHRATCTPETFNDYAIKRTLLPQTAWGLSVHELELPSGAQTNALGVPNQEIIWQILAGSGLMTLGTDQFAVVPGDVIYIQPDTAHTIRSMATTPLRINCISNTRGFSLPQL